MMLWLFFLLAATVTIITEQEEVLLFVAAGLIYMFVKAPPKWLKNNPVANSILLYETGFWQFE